MADEGAVSEVRDLDQGDEAARTKMDGMAKKTKKITKQKKQARSPAKAKKRKARKKKARKCKKRVEKRVKDQAKKPGGKKACGTNGSAKEVPQDEAAAAVRTETDRDAVEESVPAPAPAAGLNPREPEGPPRQESSPGEDPAEEHSTPEDAPEEIVPEELTPEEALAMLAEKSGRFREVDAECAPARLSSPLSEASGRPDVVRPGGRLRRPRPPGSVIMPSCRVIAFESSGVVSEMRVAATTVARLYGMVTREGFDLELGRVCQTVDELVDAWDDTPLGQSIILLVNLMGASGFLDEIVADCPEAGEAYWIVYETLRGEVTSARNEFLARQRLARRAKAIGFGPRNVVAAARSAAEAVRWRVEWGYGLAGAAKAS